MEFRQAKVVVDQILVLKEDHESPPAMRITAHVSIRNSTS